MRKHVDLRQGRMYASTALVGGERHLILRRRRPGWRGLFAAVMRRIWPQYRRAEGGSLLGQVGKR